MWVESSSEYRILAFKSQQSRNIRLRARFDLEDYRDMSTYLRHIRLAEWYPAGLSVELDQLK